MNAKLMKHSKHLWKKAVQLWMENKWLWAAQVSTAEENNELWQEVRSLQAALQASTSTSAKLAAYIKDSPHLSSPIQKHICKNASIFLHQLNPTHPFWWSIIFHLMLRLSLEEAAAALQFSP